MRKCMYVPGLDNHAACNKTRRAALMTSHHHLCFSSTTQTVMLLNSRVTKDFTRLRAHKWCRMISIAKLKPRIGDDATAGASIAHRRGVDRVKHMEAPARWIQRQVREGRIVLKVESGQHVADPRESKRKITARSELLTGSVERR